MFKYANFILYNCLYILNHTTLYISTMVKIKKKIE